MTWNTPKPQEWKSEELSLGRIIDYKAFNFVDGEGVRNSLYVSGCMFHCEGCYNAATWSFKAGIPYTKELEEQIMRDLAQPYVQGLTLLGGEPFLNSLIFSLTAALTSLKRILCSSFEDHLINVLLMSKNLLIKEKSLFGTS